MPEDIIEQIPVVRQTTNLSVRERVNKIVEIRQSLREEYETSYNRIQHWVELRNNIYAFKSDPQWLRLINTDEHLETSWHDLLSKTDDFNQKLNQLTNEKQTGDFDEAFARVERSWLNLGLVGPWRHGKSITIAKLTGLDSYIVPISQYGKCTGTTIDIINGRDVNATRNLENKILLNDSGIDISTATNKANIYFYSLPQMCQLMNEYIQRVGKPFFFNECSNADAFETECRRIRNLPEYRSPVDENNVERYNIFKEYIENARDYSKYLNGKVGVITELTKNKEFYRPFVSFLAKPDDKYTLASNETPPIIYKVLAVEHAEVFTNFQLCGEEVGEIHIVDNPGYGEARLGVYEALEKALKKELDIAIDLFKTTVGIQPNLAQEFHKLLLKCVNGRNAQDWLFYLFNLCGINRNDHNPLISMTREQILNHLNTTFYDNEKEIEGVRLSYDLNELSRRGISGHIAQVNCESEPQMLQQFFYQILDIMSSTIVNVDKTFFTKVKSQIEDAEIAYRSILEKISGIDKFLPKDKRNHVRERLKNLYESLISAFPVDIMRDLDPISKPICAICEKDNESVLLEILSHGEIKEFTPELKRDEKLEEDESIDEHAYYLKQFVAKSISVEDFKAHIEFFKYEKEKKDLKDKFSIIFSDIVNQSNIDKSILQLRNKIIEIFIKDGHLDFISKKEDEWLTQFIQLLKSGGNAYSSIVIPFEKFKERGITIEKSIIDSITSSMDNCLHINHFSTNYFDDYEDVCYEFAHSLYHIESEIRHRLYYDFNDSEQIQKFIFPVNDGFYKPNREFINRIFAIGIPAGEPHPEYDALTQFVLDHFDQIADPEFKLLQGVISEWDTKVFHYSSINQ